MGSKEKGRVTSSANQPLMLRWAAASVDSQEANRRRLAVQLAVQLPEDTKEALLVSSFESKLELIQNIGLHPRRKQRLKTRPFILEIDQLITTLGGLNCISSRLPDLSQMDRQRSHRRDLPSSGRHWSN